MTLNDLGALGDFFGGIAVIAGLFFVGVQLLTANREARIVANQKFAESIIDMGKLIYESNEMADIYLRGLTGIDCLESSERVRFVGLVGTNILRRWEYLHSHYNGELLDEDVWNSAEQMLGPFVNTKGFSEVWHDRKSWFKPSFQSYVESLMEKGSDKSLIDIYGNRPEIENTRK